MQYLMFYSTFKTRFSNWMVALKWGQTDALVRVAVSIVVLAGLALSAQAAGSSQPNIIMILADDLGWVDISGGQTNYGNGSDFYETPNIERIATQGMSFTSAYAAQNCAPTRAALMTGQYAPRNGVHNVGSLNRAGTSKLLVGPADGESVRSSAVTIAETLKTAGYTTAHFGKFHVTNNASDILNEHGFDYNYGGDSDGAPGNYFSSSSSGSWVFSSRIGPELDPYAQPYTQAYVDANLKPYANGSNVDSLVGTAKHITDAMTDAAIDFIDSQIDSGQPFYMNFAQYAIHGPLQSRPDLKDKYEAKKLSDPSQIGHDHTDYAGLTEGLDESVGRVIDYLQDPNGDGDKSDSIAENTLVIFYSDNGGTSKSENTPLLGYKGMHTEGGIRVPMVAWQPGTIAAGTANDSIVSVTDFYATFADLAGATLPDPVAQPLDSVSLTPVFDGTAAESVRDANYLHFPGYMDSRAVPTSLVTKDVGDKRYKLFYYYEDGHYELYNLTDDISETTDLLDGSFSSGDWQIAADLSVELRHWLDEVGALYPTVRATGEAVPAPTPLIASPTFNFGEDAGNTYGGQVSGQITAGGITLSLSAVGNNGLLDTNALGVGVNSDDDSGDDTVQRRIDGTLLNPESIEITFDTTVILRSIELGSLSGHDGSESLALEFVSGDNPFDNLAGYDGDYAVDADSLLYSTSDGIAGINLIAFGIGGQDNLIITAGTILSITANPATDGGFLLRQIIVDRFLSELVGDLNNDGIVDEQDWVVLSSGFATDTSGMDPVDALGVGDMNSDGIVDRIDFAAFKHAYDLANGNGAYDVMINSIPEPATALFVVIGALGLFRKKNDAMYRHSL